MFSSACICSLLLFWDIRWYTHKECDSAQLSGWVLGPRKYDQTPSVQRYLLRMCNQTSMPSKQYTITIWAPELVPEQVASCLQLKLLTSLPVSQNMQTIVWSKHFFLLLILGCMPTMLQMECNVAQPSQETDGSIQICRSFLMPKNGKMEKQTWVVFMTA